MKRVALLASGSGTNVENIIHYFAENSEVEFPLIVSNKVDAGVHERAKRLGVPSLTVDKADFANGKALRLLQEYKIDFIVLAGFLLQVPDNLLQAFPNRIINIHPSLLPKYGGKGMYGHHVHEAVVANRETESGITIHYVNEKYDEGKIIFQATCAVLPTDSPNDVAEKIHALEYEYFPQIISRVLWYSTDNVNFALNF